MVFCLHGFHLNGRTLFSWQRCPYSLPIDAQGIVVVSEIHFSFRFSLQVNTILVDREIFHPNIGLLVHTFYVSSKLIDIGNMWELGAGKYRVCGWPDSQRGVSTKPLAPLRSSTADFSTPPLVSVKTEPNVDNVVDLSDSSTKDVHVKKVVVHDSPPLFSSDSFVTPSPSRYVPLSPSVPSTSKPPPPIVQCLRRLGSIPGIKSVLKKIDYDKIKIQEVNHLPPCFDGTHLFVLLAAKVSSSLSRARSMDGMDKQYDGHVWTKTQTTNITNDVGHLQCQNTCCDFLQRANRISQVKDTEFDGFITQPLSGIMPS